MTLSILMVLVLLSTTSLYLLALCIVSFFIFLKSGLTVFQSLRECKRIANSVSAHSTPCVRGIFSSSIYVVPGKQL
jgi:hypothetical protein